MWYSALSAGRTPSPESISEHVLCGGDVLNSWLRRLRARHMAVTAVHGHHDLRGADRAADAGTLSDHLLLAGGEKSS